MKRLLKSWVFWAFIVLVPTGVVLTCCWKVEESLVCTKCGSERDFSQWRFIIFGHEAFPLSEARQTEFPTESSEHRHVWLFSRILKKSIGGLWTKSVGELWTPR